MQSATYDGPRTFFSWLTAQKIRKDEVGRLADEVLRDKTFPRHGRRLHLFLHYYDLEPRNRRATKLAHAEWRRFKKESAAA